MLSTYRSEQDASSGQPSARGHATSGLAHHREAPERPSTSADGAPGRGSVAEKTLGLARHLVHREVVRLGDRFIEWQTGRSLRFTKADRFGHELPDRKEMLRRAWHYTRFNGIGGDYAEFGCHRALTFRMAWHARELVGASAELWGFDSFAGLPDPVDQRDVHPQWVPGTLATPVERFHQLCARAGMTREHYHVVEGFYHETLRDPRGAARPEQVAIAYVDCDLYSSTVDVLEFLETRLRPGSVIAFDDYFCTNPDGPSGERRAALEHFATSTWQLVPYVQFGWSGMSFVVEHRDGLADGRPIAEGL